MTNYYSTTTTTGGNSWIYFDNGNNVQWTQPATITQSYPSYDFLFKLINEILKQRNENRGMEDLIFLLIKLEEIAKMEKDPLGYSEQGMMRIARCKSIKELMEFLKEPEEEDFEEEFGPFTLDEDEK